MDDKTLETPDLSKGVPSSSIAEGGMVVGRVGDEAVLIARAGETLYAIGAECTHYHGPLAEGLIVGETVRCPWHHACFSLKNGKALAAPALDPVACWVVVENNGEAFVTAKTPAAPPAKARGLAHRRVMIIGGGAAGFVAAEVLRRDGFAGQVTLLSADCDAPYDRPNYSKDYLAGKAPKDWMPLRDTAFYTDGTIDLRVNTEVERSDPTAKTVSIKDGETL